MRLDVSRLSAGEKLPVTFSKTVSVPPEYMLSQNDVTVRFEGMLLNAGDGFLLNGKAHAVVEAECDRCLAPLKISVTFEMEEKFSDSENAVDDDCWFYQNDEIDLSQAVETNLFVSIPIRFICDENCKGLCKICGQNKNLSDCGCKEDTIDSRFKILLKEV